jgi:hypothetical protein
MSEAHSSKLSIHPGSNKMYYDLKPYYWWTKMWKEIAAYVFFDQKDCGEDPHSASKFYKIIRIESTYNGS